MKQAWITAVLVVILAVSGSAPAQTTTANNAGRAIDPGLQRLERDIARLAKEAGGVVGVSATNIETGRRVSINGSERFPMASTFKVPIASQLLTRVDQGEIRLDRLTRR
jgi:beta-lactamase class A